MKVRKFRLLRIKHSIKLDELGTAAGISPQRVSELELSGAPVSKKVQENINNAFLEVMADRFLAISDLEADFMKNQDSLFEEVEASHEL